MAVLAKLIDLKRDLGIKGSDLDDQLTTILEAASSRAEAAAGLEDGALRRTTAIVEFPHDRDVSKFVVALKSLPIESVTEIKQVYGPAGDSTFDDATALTEGEDFVIESTNFGLLRRIYQPWHLEVRSLRVTYTGGYADPNSTIPSGASAPPADLQLGVRRDAVAIFRNRSNAGQTEKAVGDARIAVDALALDPALVSAVQRHRRITL